MNSLKISLLFLTCMSSMGAIGCSAHVGSTAKVPSDAGETCREQCETVGMDLRAMAIMANNVGCVCVDRSAAASSTHSVDAAATAGGMTALLIQEQERTQQFQAQQQQQSFNSMGSGF